MQIVIDKEKEVRKLNKMLDTLKDEKDLQSVRFAINIINNIDGIPLPKGHGRLIDDNEVKELIKGWSTYAVDKALTVLEADEENININEND